MKSFAAVITVLLLVCSAHAGQIEWSTLDLGGGYSAGWLVILVEDVSEDGFDDIYLSADLTGLVFTDPGTLNIGDDTDEAGITTALSVGSKTGTAFGTPFQSTESGDIAWGDSIYTIILNSDDISTATQYITMDSSPYELPDTDVDDTILYPEEAPYGSWQDLNVVPEPGTMGLMALGLAVIGLRKRKS